MGGFRGYQTKLWWEYIDPKEKHMIKNYTPKSDIKNMQSRMKKDWNNEFGEE